MDQFKYKLELEEKAEAKRHVILKGKKQVKQKNIVLAPFTSQAFRYHTQTCTKKLKDFPNKDPKVLKMMLAR